MPACWPHFDTPIAAPYMIPLLTRELQPEISGQSVRWGQRS